MSASGTRATRRPQRGGVWAAAMLSVAGCSHDWETYDPRLTGGSGGGPSGTGGSGGQGVGGVPGVGGAGGVPGVGGAGGSGGSGGWGGGGGGEMPGCPGGHLPLVDGFDDGTISPVWQQLVNTPALMSEVNGALKVDLPATSEAEMYGGLRSADAYDFTGCAAFVDAEKVPNPTNQAFMQLYVTAMNEMTQVEISKIAGQLQFKEVVLGQQEVLLAVPYNTTAHRSWRLREAGGLVYWETSADAGTWVVHVKKPSVLQEPLVNVGVGAGTYQVEANLPDTVRFGSVNLP